MLGKATKPSKTRRVCRASVGCVACSEDRGLGRPIRVLGQRQTGNGKLRNLLFSQKCLGRQADAVGPPQQSSTHSQGRGDQAAHWIGTQCWASPARGALHLGLSAACPAVQVGRPAPSLHLRLLTRPHEEEGNITHMHVCVCVCARV